MKEGEKAVAKLQRETMGACAPGIAVLQAAGAAEKKPPPASRRGWRGESGDGLHPLSTPLVRRPGTMASQRVIFHVENRQRVIAQGNQGDFGPGLAGTLGGDGRTFLVVGLAAQAAAENKDAGNGGHGGKMGSNPLDCKSPYISRGLHVVRASRPEC